MESILATFELALFIVLPLILFYQRMGLGAKEWVPKVVMLYLTWFFSYALLHELCHLAASWLTGVTILECRLVPHYWEGDFRNAWIKSEFHNDTQLFFSPAAPYLRDLLFLAAGWLMFRKRVMRGTFWEGLLLVLFILSPVYDVFNNYFASVLGSRNDFSTMARSVGTFPVHLFGILLVAGGIIILWNLVASIKKQRDI